MIVTRLLPSPGIEVDLDAPDAATALEELYRPPRRRWLRLNLVASLNGEAAGADGTSETLTSRTDRRILGAIRRCSDVVLVGASSVRTEGYLLPRTAPLAVLTASGDLSGHHIPADVAEGRVVVLCPPAATDAVRSSLGGAAAAIIELPGPRIAPAEALAALHGLGHESIVCEGGPALAAQLVDADLVDELCLTTSPSIVPGERPVLPGLAGGHPLLLSQLLADEEGMLYARWTMRG
jgi:riboflavin biosynthesis pyrimidine reductase